MYDFIWYIPRVDQEAAKITIKVLKTRTNGTEKENGYVYNLCHDKSKFF